MEPLFQRVVSSLGEIAIPELVVFTGFAKSNKQARQLLKDGAVSLDGAKLNPEDHLRMNAADVYRKVLRVGRQFVRITPSEPPVYLHARVSYYEDGATAEFAGQGTEDLTEPLTPEREAWIREWQQRLEAEIAAEVGIEAS